jgi:hypothetical protein
MVFNPYNCWDCSLTPAAFLGQFATFIAVALLGLWLLRRRATVLKALGDVVLFMTLFIGVLLSIYVPRWGVFRLGSETDLYPVPAIRLAYVGFIGVLLLVRANAYRRAGTSRRQDQP